jgi:phosphotriesterase-related protein
MAIVRTVVGDVAPEEMGFFLPHEHLITFPPCRVRSDPDYRLQDVDKAIEEVNSFKGAGGDSLMDATTLGYGRDVLALKRISEATGVHIVSTTGFIMEQLMPREAYNMTPTQLTDMFIKDVTEGADGTDVKCGILKFGTSYDRFYPIELKAAKSVIATHKELGCAITTHTTGGTMAFSQVELLKEEQVDLSRVIIGHMDRNSLNIGYLLMLCRTGVNIEFDNIGKTKYYPDSLRIDMITQLIDAGFVGQIFLSDDNGRQSYFRSYGGGPGLDYIPTTFVSMMEAAGVSPEDIDQMTRHNPQRLYAF